MKKPLPAQNAEHCNKTSNYFDYKSMENMSIIDLENIVQPRLPDETAYGHRPGEREPRPTAASAAGVISADRRSDAPLHTLPGRPGAPVPLLAYSGASGMGRILPACEGWKTRPGC
ncbi:hypothetical protein [Labrys neptuniae]